MSNNKKKDCDCAVCKMDGQKLKPISEFVRRYTSLPTVKRRALDASLISHEVGAVFMASAQASASVMQSGEDPYTTVLACMHVAYLLAKNEEALAKGQPSICTDPKYQQSTEVH
jgi:hypothetical protein